MSLGRRLISTGTAADVSFNTVLYTGNASARSITGVGFQPDLTWIKNRSSSSNYFHALIDSVRGVGKVLSSNTSSVDSTNYTDQLTSFNLDGFSLGNNSSGGNYVNVSGGDNYVAWNWKGGGTPVTIGVNSITGSTPSIASSVSANTAAGFSIVKYTPPSGGSVYTNTVGHGLSSPPEIIIQKATQNSSASWYVHTSLIDGSNDYLVLNSTAPKADNPHNFAVTSTTFTDWGWNGNEIINYCWHSVVGYSKIGIYEGVTGNKTVTIGFRPSFVIIKNTSNAGNNWNMMDSVRDTSNPIELNLWADTADTESTASQGNVYDVDFEDTGFTIKNNFTPFNANEQDYIYMAFK